MRDADVVAVVALKGEPSVDPGFECPHNACPLIYRGIIITSIKNGEEKDEIEFLSSSLLTVENPYLVFLDKTGSTQQRGAPVDRSGTPSTPNVTYSVATLDGTQYGALAAFEERYLTAEEKQSIASEAEELFFIGHGSALSLFMDDLSVLGARFSDQNGDPVTIKASLNGHMLRENFGRVRKSSIALESTGFLGLLRDVASDK